MLGRLNSLAELFQFFNFWLSPLIHPCILQICDDKSIKYWMKILCQTQICEHTYTLLWVKKRHLPRDQYPILVCIDWFVRLSVDRTWLMLRFQPLIPWCQGQDVQGETGIFWTWDYRKMECLKINFTKNCKQSVIMNTAKWK